jgi:hypothetical protein
MAGIVPGRFRQCDTGTRGSFFIILVDATFTILVERLFTKAFRSHCPNRNVPLRVSRVQPRLTPRQPKFDTNKEDRILRMY